MACDDGPLIWVAGRDLLRLSRERSAAGYSGTSRGARYGTGRACLARDFFNWRGHVATVPAPVAIRPQKFAECVMPSIYQPFQVFYDLVFVEAVSLPLDVRFD